MKYLLITIILILGLILPNDLVLADSSNKFQYHFDNWNKNIKLASQYLDEAEKELRNGNEAQGCIQQRKAANYGIEATNSLIKAFKESGSTKDLSDIQSGLNKWEELRDFC